MTRTEPAAKSPAVTQEMIDLYDEYTHVTLDRRGFMNRLTALVGSTTAAVAITSLIEARKAAAQVVAADDPRLSSETATWTGATDMKGTLVRPAGTAGRLPAVMVIHENRGLVPHIQDVARRLALEGFLVLAPDFLTPSGGTPENEDTGRQMIGALDPKKTVENAVAGVSFLAMHDRSNGNVGAVGFCWGGAMVNQLAAASGDALDAGVAYYGRQVEAEAAARIKAALLLHYAGMDDRINAGIDAYRSALETAKVDHTIHVYDGVQHAFNNDTSAARYNEAAATLAWSRTVAFLKQKLTG